MVPQSLLQAVAEDVQRYCAAKGYVRGPNWNPLVPQNAPAALAMAKLLLLPGRFDHIVAVAPEGCVYGYFFERLGARVLSVFVDYPPRRVELVDDLTLIRDGRVLVLEDDVVSGVTLELVASELARFAPRSWSLYLGRSKDGHQLEHIPPSAAAVYLAEDCLDPKRHGQYGAEFIEYFAASLPH